MLQKSYAVVSNISTFQPFILFYFIYKKKYKNTKINKIKNYFLKIRCRPTVNGLIIILFEKENLSIVDFEICIHFFFKNCYIKIYMTVADRETRGWMCLYLKLPHNFFATSMFLYLNSYYFRLPSC